MKVDINIPQGIYVVAVSGGVDSVVLLDILVKQKSIKIIVAHFDHGIRQDSVKDANFVKKLASKYSLAFEHQRIELGKNAGESEAREKRYEFLNFVKQKYHAKAIITAHHQDDVIETSMINILRGTGRRGLTSLKSQDELMRPLINFPKKDLVAYAKLNNITWREDSTNQDTKILRNYLRLKVIPKLTSSQRQEWLKILDNAQVINQQLDKELSGFLRKGLHKNKPVLSRKWFIMLPYDISKEVLLTLLYNLGAKDIDKKSIERLTVQIKTLPAGKVLQTVGIDIMLTKRSARFYWRDGQEYKK